MKSIGFDLGSAYTKAVLLDESGHLELSYYGKQSAADIGAITGFLDRVAERFPLESFRCGLVGGRVESGIHADDLMEINGITAVAAGITGMGLKPCRIIEIGGHSAKSILLNPDSPDTIRDFTIHDACAAGSGSFFESQAERLRMSVGDLAVRSAAAAREAVIAGRCAVFAKSDMIHLQQKGTPIDEIAFGVCMAICRNAVATLLKGQAPEPPVVIAGGCAQNGGIIRAFRTIFGLDQTILIPSPCPGLEGAIGAAMKAGSSDTEPRTVSELKERVARRIAACASTYDFLEPLRRPSGAARRKEPEEPFPEPLDGFLGVDVGSVSTDFVITDARGELISSLYLPTRGAPLEVLREGLATLKARFPAGLRVLGCGTTGSGRHLAGKLLGADSVKNEITCQLLGARRYLDDVESIIEIGGQDSKFISVRNGQISDFAMNKICAAGTGSFLEEQAVRMQISIIDEFAERAFAAKSPRNLGSRCTVFMETEVVDAIKSGASIEDMCAGLACSIVRNYLEKVVGNRPLGGKILLQGGTASNDAVVAAFEHVLERPISIHPYNRISGAIGAADAARSSIGAGKKTKFRGLEPGARPTLQAFRCNGCPNNCEVNLLERDGERIYFGDTCERYTSLGSGVTPGVPLPNLAAEYVKGCESFFDSADAKAVPGPVIGIPRTSVLMASLPFWGRFFREIGCTPVLSDNSDADMLALGLKHLSVAVCLPIKLTAGHANALLEKGVDRVFLPSVIHLPGERPEQSHTCPYSMAVPFMITSAHAGRLLSPALSLTDEASFTEGMMSCREALQTSAIRIREAYRAALAAQKSFDAGLAERGRRLLAEGGFRRAFAILGKPYNTFDAFLNLSLFERLRRMGILAMPPQYLSLAASKDETDLPWGFSADIFRYATADAPDIHPVIVSNFGCGPDAFTFKQLEPRLSEKPHLVLEFDEHRGEAGLMTRLEAFQDQLENTGPKALRMAYSASEDRLRKQVSNIPEPGTDIRIPHFGDIVYAFSGMWKLKGYRVEILPPPDRSSRVLGERHTQGKECLPYSVFAGDLLRLQRTSGNRKLTFYVPGLSFPCLLQQYGTALRHLVNERGIANITLATPTGAELIEAFGTQPLEAFYMGLLAIELLVKAACEIRPYEREKGTTQALHDESLRRIETSVVNGNVADALDESLLRLAAVKVDRTVKRPLIGISGDIFAKASSQGGGDLFRMLEHQGMEVWPSPFHVDFLDFSITRRFMQSLGRLSFPEMLASGSVALRRTIDFWRLKYMVGNRIRHLDEPGYLELKKLARPYITNEEDELLFVNIAKIVDFQFQGVDGIINASCFNCMVGNASAAIIEKIRRDYPDTPIITATQSGGADPSRQMVLEAFIGQVKANSRRRACVGR